MSKKNLAVGGIAAVLFAALSLSGPVANAAPGDHHGGGRGTSLGAGQTGDRPIRGDVETGQPPATDPDQPPVIVIGNGGDGGVVVVGVPGQGATTTTTPGNRPHTRSTHPRPTTTHPSPRPHTHGRPAADPDQPPATDPEPPATDPEPPATDPTPPNGHPHGTQPGTNRPGNGNHWDGRLHWWNRPPQPPADDNTEPPADDNTEPPADDTTEPPADQPPAGDEAVNPPVSVPAAQPPAAAPAAAPASTGTYASTGGSVAGTSVWLLGSFMVMLSAAAVALLARRRQMA